jgi:hypothetical protein
MATKKNRSNRRIGERRIARRQPSRFAIGLLLLSAGIRRAACVQGRRQPDAGHLPADPGR